MSPFYNLLIKNILDKDKALELNVLFQLYKYACKIIWPIQVPEKDDDNPREL